MRRSVFSLAALIAVTTACGGGDNGLSPYTCERDEAAMASQVTCTVDFQCPCGTHCSFGLCSSACTVDSDCTDGERCDYLGRCRAADDRALLPAPPQRLGSMSLSTKQLRFSTPGDEGRVLVWAVGQDVGRVRVAAPAGYQVACDDDGAPSSECWLEDVIITELGRVVRVTTGDDWTGAQLRGDLALHSTSERLVVALEGVAAQSARRRAARGAKGPGRYMGFAWPLESGLGSDRSFTPALATLAIPLTIEVFPAEGAGSHRIRLSEPLGILVPDVDGTEGTLDFAADSWLLQFQSRRVLGPDAPGNEALEILAHAETVANFTWEGDLLQGTIAVSYDGVAPTGREPNIYWRVSVTYADDQVDAADLTDQIAVAQTLDTTTQAETAFPFEDSVRLGLASMTGLPLSEQVQAILCTPSSAATPYVMLEGLLQVATTDGGDVYAEAADGDLACGPGPDLRTGTLAFPLMSTDIMDAQADLTACLADIGRWNDANDASTPVLVTDGCADLSRAAFALVRALDNDRDRAVADGSAVDAEASTLAQRIVQQWLTIAQYVGTEALQVQRLNSVVDPANSLEVTFSTKDAVIASLSMWDLLLHPRIAVALSALSQDTLADPDYRARLFPALAIGARKSHVQSVGLPVFFVRTLRVQLGLMDALAQEVLSQRLPRAEFDEQLGAFARRATPALALAEGMYFRARSIGVPPWEAEWQAAKAELSTAAAAMLLRIADMNAGRNLLGIEPGDLPLYRVGDQTGDLERFSALSDFLLGVEGTTQGGVAPAFVERAEQELEDAQAAYLDNLTRRHTDQLNAAAQARREEELNRRYGEQIIGLCGNPDWLADTVLQESIDPETCYIASTDPACQVDTKALQAKLDTGDLQYRLCIAAYLRTAYGDNVTFDQPDLEQLVKDMGFVVADDPDAAPPKIKGWSLAGNRRKLFIESNGTTYEMEPWELDRVKTHAVEGVGGYEINYARNQCERFKAEAQAGRPVNAPEECTTTDDCPLAWYCDGQYPNAGQCYPGETTEVGRNESPDCFLGSLGEMALSLLAASREIDIARSELANMSDYYDNAMKSCMIRKLGDQQMEAALALHNEVMTGLGSAKLAVDIVANYAASTKDCASQIGSSDKSFLGAITSAGSVGIGCSAAYVEGTAKSASDSLQLAMDETERKHEQTMQYLENLTDEQVCFNDAEQHLIGTRTAILRIQNASLELSRQLVEFTNLKNSLAGLLIEGHQAVQYEKERAVPPLSTNVWLDERIETYDRHMRMARRAVYLAVLAVEYEYQYSSGYKTATLAATRPEQLMQIIDGLAAETLTGTVAGGAPKSDLRVVSLRDHVLRLPDLSGTDGWDGMSEAEQLRVLLQHWPVLDPDDGSVVGYRVPFVLAPDGAGEASMGFDVIGQTDCAERIWAVNASIIGEGDLNPGSETTLAKIVLRKSNSFYSQWCNAPNGASAYQEASSRPERNLFHDPYAYDDARDVSQVPQPPAASGAGRSFTDARISAYFNVTTEQLESESYFNGDSQELAGRGLYGEYELYLPAAVLGSGATNDDGLYLEHVTDILLRFDYVSVAKPL